MVPSAINSARSGIIANLETFNEAARKLSSSRPEESVGGIVEMEIAKTAIAANMAVVRADQQNSEFLVDMLA